VNTLLRRDKLYEKDESKAVREEKIKEKESKKFSLILLNENP